jgi:Plavaka transposase
LHFWLFQKVGFRIEDSILHFILNRFHFSADREHQDCKEFRKFRHNLFHGSIREILQSLRQGMEEAEIIRFADGHFRRAIYEIGPYIADYPEQVLCTCIVQGWCARYIFISAYYSSCLCPIRCDAPSDNLDGEGGRRSHELTLALFDALDKKALWDDYGIIDDIMVSQINPQAIQY